MSEEFICLFRGAAAVLGFVGNKGWEKLRDLCAITSSFAAQSLSTSTHLSVHHATALLLSEEY